MEAASAVSRVRRPVPCGASTTAAIHEGHRKFRLSGIARGSLPNTLRLPPPSLASCSSYSIAWTSGGGRRALSSNSDLAATAQNQLALVLEVDGVLVDAYRVGNRKAFNQAFENLGLDCAKWTEPIYNDLARKSNDDEETMLALYFNSIGWPSSLPTREKSAFVKSMLQAKKNAMDEFMMSKDLPFRPGVQEFIDEACDGGIPMVIMTAYSRCGEKVSRSITERLGEERTSKIKIVGWKDVEQSLYGQLVLSKGMLSGLDEQLSEEVRKPPQRDKE